MTTSQTIFGQVCELIRERTGLDCTAQNTPDISRAIGRGMEQTNIADRESYYERLCNDDLEFGDLIAEVTVGETYFFREPVQFEFLRHTILPDLHWRMGRRNLKVWSAGCSTGEEAYTLAMVLAEEGFGQSQVLATDISRTALAKAKEGTYREWSLRGPAAELARRWLIRADERYQVADELRGAVAFKQLNLAGDEYPCFTNGTRDLDLIFCRNVLIYFNRETVSKVARRLFDSLVPGGWLVTSASDPPLVDLMPWETKVTHAGLIYRRPAESVQLPVPLEISEPATVPVVAASIKPPPAPVEPIDIPALFAEIHSLASSDPLAADALCQQAIKQHHLSAELHYLQAVLWQAQGRTSEAESAVRRAIYLDRSLAVAHFLLGVISQQQGDIDGARRAYRNVAQLCASQSAGDVVACSAGETVSHLAGAANAYLAILDAAQESHS